MNRVKQLAVIFLVFIMMFGLSVPVYADNTADYTFDLQSTVQSVYAGTTCTVSYYHPTGYPNVWVGFASYGGGYSNGGDLYIIYFQDGTTFGCTSGGINFNKEVIIGKVKSISAMEDILFNGANFDGTKTTSGGPAWSNSYIYQEVDPGMRQNGNPTTLETYYYNWYFNQHGYYPVGIQIKVDFICNGEIVESQQTETIAGTSVLLQDIIQEPEGYAWDTISIFGVDYQKSDSYIFTKDTDIVVLMTKTAGIGDTSGIIDKLHEIWEAVIKIANPAPDYSFLADMNNRLANKLEDNGFYTSICKIQRELTSIYKQDYTDPAGFHEVNPAKITLRRPIIASADDGFGGSYTYSKIDWGLDNVSILGDMKWFFGTHYATGNGNSFINIDGSFAVKHYSDLLISAFLWVGFAFMLWQQLPNIISGDMATFTSMSADMINTSVSGSRTIEDVYTTTTVDTKTGEVLSDTTTYKQKKRRKK